MFIRSNFIDRTYQHALIATEPRQVPIVVKLRSDARADLDLLSRLSVPGARGPVMLGARTFQGNPYDGHSLSKHIIHGSVAISACW